MTAKDLKNKGGVERGVTREQGAIKRRKKLKASLLSSGSDSPKRSFPKGMTHGMKRMLKLQMSLAALADFDKKLCAIEEERFGDGGLPDRVVPFIPFNEKPFGEEVIKGGQELYGSSVVSLALFDGDCVEKNMLFACSGITLQHGTAIQELTRFVTSACFVEEFKRKRNRDDDLRIQVRLPNNTTKDGLLGLYDEDIAIVTSIGCLRVDPVDFDLLASPDHPDGHVLAVGRAFNSGSLMAMRGSLSNESPNIFLSDSQGFTEAALGGPLVGNDKTFHGLIVDLRHDGGQNRSAKFISQKSLRERLELFQILNPKKLHFYGYSLPSGVSCEPPSGFMKTIYHLRSLGYPMPPPLVLEFNGELLYQFEDRFGELRAWKGYPFGDLPNDRGECVWAELEKKVVTKISRRVVSLASFNNDYTRSFACSGLLIKWHGSRAKRTVVLTSASLVRSRDNESNIDEKLRIQVFLPPNQRCDGTLEWYHLDKNIAIVSVKKGFNATHPEDIFNEDMQKSSSERVVALGRDTIHGLLMGTVGKVKKNYKDRKLECQELRCSTCKIKKAGIGGPLIDFDGTFVGMNFYDGRDLTPFLPRANVVDALRRTDPKLPSESGWNPVRLDAFVEPNRWPVPEPYWYHGALDEDIYDVPELMGRTLM